jgi:hypothetical protein
MYNKTYYLKTIYCVCNTLRANRSKGRDAKPWVKAPLWNMIAGLPDYSNAGYQGDARIKGSQQGSL